MGFKFLQNLIFKINEIKNLYPLIYKLIYNNLQFSKDILLQQ